MIKQFTKLCFLGLLLISMSSASEKLSELSIPYPHFRVYQSNGVTGSIGLGHTYPRGKGYDNIRLFHWQGEGAFYYKPYLSGGVSARILSGEPIENATQTENHFLAFSRFHKVINKEMAFFIGPALGFNVFKYVADKDTSKSYDLITKDDLVLKYGIDMGGGYKLTPRYGVAWGGALYHSWNVETVFNGSLGFSLDINEMWEHTRRSTRSFYLSLETQYAKILDKAPPIRDYELILLIGFGVGF